MKVAEALDTVIDAPSAAVSYAVDRVPLDEIRNQVGLRPATSTRFPMQNPVWLSGYFEDQLQDLSCYSVSRAGDAAGVV